MPTIEQIMNYLSYLGTGLMLLGLFCYIYTFCTPIREWTLIRQGNGAAACSMGGAVLGFSLTLAACFASHASLPAATFWSLCAMVIQLLA